MSLDIFDDSDSSPETPAKPKPKRRRWLIVLVVFGVLFALLAAIASFYLISLNNALNQIQREPGYAPSYEQRPPENTTKAVNVMLLGSDSRGAGDTGRSDVIMWVHVSADRKDVYITSFTRDMWVSIPGYGQGKINWALAFGGVPLQVQTVETLIGARADHVASIDFEGFIKLTDALGGVTVYNKYASGQGSPYVFPQGEITVSGEQALMYVRERYTLPQGAWSRAERQRDVIAAIILKILSPGVLGNPVKFNELAGEVSKTIKVDSSVTNQLIYDTALSMRVSSKANLHSIQAPITGGGQAGDQYIDVPNLPQLQELGTAFRTDTVADYLKKYPK